MSPRKELATYALLLASDQPVLRPPIKIQQAVIQFCPQPWLLPLKRLCFPLCLVTGHILGESCAAFMKLFGKGMKMASFLL